MLLSYQELLQLVEDGVIKNVTPDMVNGSSINLTLGRELLIEAEPDPAPGLLKKVKKFFKRADIYGDLQDNRGQFPYSLLPDRFLIDVGSTEPLCFEPYQLEQAVMAEASIVTYEPDPYVLRPNEFVLGHTEQSFDFPDDISAQYHLRSSLGRIGLEHLNAGWCDPWWSGSVLTLELKNITRYHYLKLTKGCPIGQLTFHRHSKVPKHAGYKVKGRYNNDMSVSPSKRIA